MKTKVTRIVKWAPRYPETENRLDGRRAPYIHCFDFPIRNTRDVMMHGGSDVPYSDIKMMVESTRPMMVLPFFETKRECKLYIKERWGYLIKRPDLRREPHCWRTPKPVRVTVTVTEGVRE